MHRKAIIFIVVLIFFLSIYSALAFYLVTPKPTQPFIGFGVFSQQGVLSRYFPGSNPTITINQPVNWHLEITNEMGSVQLVQTVFRIGNVASITPNATSPASTASQLDNSTVFVPDRKTAVVPFTWTVLGISSSGGLEFLKMNINGHQVTSNMGTASGKDFRLLFELWTFDESSGMFQYGWQDSGLRIGSWLQVWFSVSS